MKGFTHSEPYDVIAAMHAEAMATGWLCFVRPHPKPDWLTLVLVCDLTPRREKAA